MSPAAKASAPAAPAPQGPRPRRWLRRLGLAVLILLGVVGLFTAIGVAWYRSDGDLDPVRARAQQLGIELDWDRVPQPVLTGPRREAFGELMKWLPDYERVTIDGVPQAVAIPDAVAKDLVPAIERIGPGPVAWNTMQGLNTRKPELRTTRSVSGWLSEQIAVAPAADLPRLHRAALMVATWHSGQVLLDGMIGANTVTGQVQALVRRHQDLSGDLDLAEQWRSIGAGMDGLSVQGLEGEIRLVWWNAVRRDFRDISGGDKVTIGTRWLWRSGRAPALLGWMEDLERLRADPSIAGVTVAQDHATRRAEAGRYGLWRNHRLDLALQHPVALIDAKFRETRARCLILAALLDGVAMPNDPRWPDQPLLQRTVDGRRVALYGRGDNGSDDGGSDRKLDWIVWMVPLSEQQALSAPPPGAP